MEAPATPRSSAAQSPATKAEATAAPAYRWWALALLTLAYAAHSMDRAMPNILVEPVRREFHLSDARLALFTGSGFGIAFAIAVLPMGYLSDRVNRRNFLAVILLAWSACTALGGLTRNFAQLTLTRVAVGAAESGAAPVILPLLADIFPVRRRAFATGILYVGVPLGGVAATILGGWIAAEHGWRSALFLAGAPGLLVAALLFLTIKTPHETADEEDAAPLSLKQALRFILQEPGLIAVMLGCALLGLVAIGLAAWSSSFFVRIWHMPLKNVALLLGLAGGLTGMCSPLIWGAVADRAATREVTSPLVLMALASVVAFVAGGAWLFSPVFPITIAAFLLSEFLRNGYPALTYPVLIAHTPPRMRGTVMSILQLITNLVGFVVGPLVVGLISDHFGGGTAIRYGMACIIAMYVAVVALLLTGAWLLRRRTTHAAG